MTHERAAAEAEALPRFNEHTPLPWKEGTMGVWIFGGAPPSGTGDIICEMPTDAPDSIENWPTNRAFILEACNTYYDRLSALSAKEEEVRELVEALRGLQWPNVISADDLAILGAMCAGSEKSAASVGEMVTQLRAAQSKAEAILSKHPQP